MPQVALIHVGVYGPNRGVPGWRDRPAMVDGTSVGKMSPVNQQSPTALAEADACWVRSRRRALMERLASHDLTIAVSSGCAASGAARHASEIEARAARALERLLAGLTESCEECGGPIPRERLDAILTATRCVPCAGSGTVDTRWCR
jgi:hypothetical protein